MNPDEFSQSLDTLEDIKKKNNQIFVTRPDLPPLDEFVEYLEKIWDKRWVTNNGLYHQQFEQALADYLGVKYVSLFSNGTLALVVALQVMRITGEVITTPFSFVATTHALNWNKINPVFCDIDPQTLNLDPEKIEPLITPKTAAILPVHVYGNPCNVEKIGRIADTYGLKVIYDAAHAFGVKKKNESILNFGDLSVLSFHATKIFTTMEGGAIATNDEKLKTRIDYLKNFGFADETTVMAPGINGKMNEMQSALGIVQLKYIDERIQKRKSLTQLYRDILSNINGISYLPELENVTHNYAYFPIFIEAEKFGCARDAVYEFLKDNEIYARRYFYPLISHFPMYRGLASSSQDNLPIAEEAAKRVICLPLYPEMSTDDVLRITNLINQKAI
ncbi:MAG: DegT/DnrJ/EryC1/StrS family aminotransferase [Calditrichaeota bacterium]|nr:MAG: DegT/DnrJ/EryC1/StrS family aminotransferase [Calditrichota bacterium]MBL1204044.1 DegT/DnrJ/EryC1/StrS family aminotransferase [Calditrichota bacterium]NOG43875.1 DegT/DnrJ/EryC1/StrS family aminotransferase [Calditrichota bacterium]